MLDLLLLLELLVWGLTLWLCRMVVLAGMPPGQADWLVQIVSGPVDRLTLIAIAVIAVTWIIYRVHLQLWADQVAALSRIADRMEREGREHPTSRREQLRADIGRAMLHRLSAYLAEPPSVAPGRWERVERRLLLWIAARAAPSGRPANWILTRLWADLCAVVHRHCLLSAEALSPDAPAPPPPAPPRPLLHRLLDAALRPMLHRIAWNLSRRNLDPLRSGPLRPVWEDFERSLIRLPEPAPDPGFARSQPAAFFFSPQADLPEEIRPHWLLPTGQSVLLTLGILGTFTGLFIGLNNSLPGFQAAMQPATGSAADLAQSGMSRALSELLNGAQLAFSKSIAGLLFSLVFTWRYRQQEERFADALHRIAAALDGFYPLRTQEQLLAALTEELRLARLYRRDR